MARNPFAVSSAIFASALLLGGCNGGGSGAGAVDSQVGGISLPAAASLSPAEPDSPFGDILIDCVVAESAIESCTLEILPLIGNQLSIPSVDDIMDRVVVSDPWMAMRFRQLLNVLPPDIRSLMAVITAVVIARDVRPSFFSYLSGAIYIDPARLWLLNSEKATVSRDPDYRVNFGDDLSFVSVWRYLDGNNYAWQFYDLEGIETRAIVDIERPMAAFLFHELAHANDAIPPDEIAGLDISMSYADNIDALIARSASARLNAQQPLISQLLNDLALVLFAGLQATDQQRALTPEQVGLEFETDGASDDYAYTATAEDVAMLFEEVMMRFHYGLDRELAYTDAPSVGNESFCDEYPVRWGFRNRVGVPLAKARAERALQLLLGLADVSPYLDTLPDPWRMSTGISWCTIQTAQSVPASPPIKGSATQRGAAESTRNRIRTDDLGPVHR